MDTSEIRKYMNNRKNSKIVNIHFRNFKSEDVSAVVAIQDRCLKVSSDTGKFEPGFWLSPGFENGKNIIVAENRKGQVIGYAATTSAYYSNSLEARIFWIDLRTNPNFDPNLEIKDQLLEKITRRGYEIKIEENRDRAALGATYFSQGKSSIDYLRSHGFTNFETMFAMQRNLSDSIPKCEQFPAVEIKSWKMESKDEKVAYLTAREAAFGYPLGRLDLLEHFTHSELWQGGTSFTAFRGDEIIGSVMALSNGLIDYVFVLPDWRRKGIAKALVIRALQFLREQKHAQTWLEVSSHNQIAVGLYQSLGFEIFKEEISLGLLLD